MYYKYYKINKLGLGCPNLGSSVIQIEFQLKKI